MAEFQQDENLPENDFQPPLNRVLSKNFHRRFPTVAAYVSELGGSRSRVIEKVLISNNGVAAVKAIRSIRRWAYEVFGNERAISFVVMATPEDLRANAEYIRMGDVIVDVPGGSNNHNYANVTLIVELARLHGVQAVWAGWGHASENPALPDTLEKSEPPIKFIGPSGPPMRALGDKIGSTIIAQSAGVPCIAWNGENIKATYDKATGSLPGHAFEDATIANAVEARAAAEKIGFPIMIKASEGGGGKGIRRVERAEDVANAFRQVSGEVPGSPIFIMKLSSNSRHLEVQLLADEYGDAVALNGRDCSVQRRHQKIIEEGPPIAAKPEVWAEMERAAVALAKAVGYTNAGTVEYLYSEVQAKFYFLELNPRLQVEHPVTEMITQVNLPAAQLQVAMGIPLDNIPEIRELYGRHRFEDNAKHPSARIDFENTPRVPPNGHCIAVRITAENAEAGFKPTSGGIQELNFRSTPSVWGYFSMDSSGSIHEFADSQFGHLFATGPDRELARRAMVLALKELSIRGDISTTVDFISKLIELEDYVENTIDTGWLDSIIKENVEGMGAMRQKRKPSVAIQKVHEHAYVVIGALVLAFDRCVEGEKKFLELLEKGQLPPQRLLNVECSTELILSGVKYKLICTRNGPNSFAIRLAETDAKPIATSVRTLSDGGYLIEMGGISHLAYVTSKLSASAMRLNVGGADVAFAPDYDPSSLRTDVAGKLVKKLKQEGAKVKKGEEYAEIECMKMFMPLKVEESGTISWLANEGAAIASGDLLATLVLDNPDNVSKVAVFEGDLVVSNGSTLPSSKPPHLMLRGAVDKLTCALSGFQLSSFEIERAFDGLAVAALNPRLPVLEIEEQLSILSGRMPAPLFQRIGQILGDFSNTLDRQLGSGIQLRFPAEDILAQLKAHSDGFKDPDERASFDTSITPLRDIVSPYALCKAAGVPGSERVLQSFLSMLRNWISVERWFFDGKPRADVVEALRKAYKTDAHSVLRICRAHEQLQCTSEVVLKIMGSISDALRVDVDLSGGPAVGRRVSIVAGAVNLPQVIPALSELSSMRGSNDKYAEVALRARKLLLLQSMPTLEQRRQKVLAACKTLSLSSDHVRAKEVEELLADVPMVDVLSLLKASASNQGLVGLVELHIRQLYRPYTVRSLHRDAESRLVLFNFVNKPSEKLVSESTSLASITELSRMMSSGSMNKLSDASHHSSSEGLLTAANREKIPENLLRCGVSVVIDSLEDVSDKLATVLSRYGEPIARPETVPANVLYFLVLGNTIGTAEDVETNMAVSCEKLLSPFQTQLQKANVRRVSFVFDQPQEDELENYPAVFNFRYPNYEEDSLYRRIFPSLAIYLDLNRIAANFHIRSLTSRHTPACDVYLYEATPRKAALSRDKAANKAPRIFGRALSFVMEFSSSSFERVLVDALNAFDLCSVKGRGEHHLFLQFIKDFELLDALLIEQVVMDNLKRHGPRISEKGIVEVEVRLVGSLSPSSPPIAIRLLGSNPTGYVQTLNTYVEAGNEQGGERVFKLISGAKASLSSAGDSSMNGLNVNSPYPLTRPFDTQRAAALRASDTLYCYDLPALFEAAVEKQWVEASKGGGISGAVRPLMVMYTTELVVQKGNDPNASWTMKDYLNGDLQLVETSRGAGANDVGMVVWLVSLKTVEYPNGRQVVLIANDITFKAGSFGTREDVVFKLASEFARVRRIPRLFIAANSGARIGLADRIKKSYKVAFNDPKKPENGFDYLYVTKKDYELYTSQGKEIIAEPCSLDGEVVYRLTDIIGSEPDLGVENLKGSGLIAGETSAAYNDIFTLTLVLGRTVGIGAYLVRLGQRTIQKSSGAPIILTGYQALNTLMGTHVYSTNDQLGGPGIMYSNGVSHLIEHDHLGAVKAAIDWLSFVPSTRGGLLPVTDIRGVDEVERRTGFTPRPGVPYDPRCLLAGVANDAGFVETGFFDRGSFQESLAGWAKTVVVGRARLGGIPIGVIMTENRTTEAVKPADPADVKASEAVIQEAGCVWYPNSAYKTAQAIQDFRTEDLPLIIFANWRGFSGGQRDMFDEILKYGSKIVDAFVAFEQPVFVMIPPYAEIRGGAWVVLDSSINPSVMEMYAATSTARGGVLEANGAASVKYRTKDLITTMHRLDDKLIDLDHKLAESVEDLVLSKSIRDEIRDRENALLPVYEQIAVHFCDLQDTPGRMKAVGVIHKEVDWQEARSYFYWRLRRKLAEFDLRRQLVQAAEVGRGVQAPTSLEASAMIKSWFMESSKCSEEQWDDDKRVLRWMAECHSELEQRILTFTKEIVVKEVLQVMTAGGNTARIGTAGIIEGLAKALKQMSPEDQQSVKQMLAQVLSDK